MNSIPSYLEDRISQIPALHVLQNLGYEYVASEEVFRLRGSKRSSVILDEVLEQQLRKINVIRFKGQECPFSNVNISNKNAATPYSVRWRNGQVDSDEIA